MKLLLAGKAERDLNKLDDNIRKRIVRALEKLTKKP